MDMDREPDASSGAGRAQGPGPPGAELDIHALTTAVARVMDAVPEELVLCTAAGSVLHVNHPARKRLEADEGRRSLEEEVRFLCVALHLQITEKAAVNGTEGAVSQAERRVMLDGSEMHLRAVDLGVPRDGRLTPVILVRIDVQPLSDRELKQLGLTGAEIRVARMVVQGRSNREIAHTLNISIHTVRHHVQRIHEKAGVRSRTQLAKILRIPT